MEQQIKSVEYDLVLLKDKRDALQQSIQACHNSSPELERLVRFRKDCEDEIAFLEEELRILKQQ